MTLNPNKYFRVLAISPSTSGFGFVVVEGNDTLADWGTKSARKDKNDWCVAQAEKLIRKYEPHAIVLYDHANDPRRSQRIRDLNKRFANVAKRYKIRVKFFSREEVEQVFAPDAKATKYQIAKTLAERVPDELAKLLPAQRRAWDSEDRRMDIFDAMALVVTFRRGTK
jgi:hypothetical protein